MDAPGRHVPRMYHVPQLARGRVALHFGRRASQLMGSSTHPLSQRDVHFTAELGAEAMRLACATQIEPADGAKREDCTVLLLISSAAGYERRRDVVRRTYLSLLDPASAASPLSAELRASVKYRFLLGAPEPAQAAALAAEQAEHGDLLQVAVPESYETLFPKLVASWRWAICTHKFQYFMHADDDSFVRLEKLLAWLTSYEARAPERAPRLYAGYIWDGSEGRRTKPLRDPAQKSYMPVEQWPHDAYPPFASGCGFLIAHQLVDALARRADGLQYCRLFDVPVGIAIAQHEPPAAIEHLPEVRPYRPLPLYQPDTIVQHYMQPEEFRQFFDKAYGAPPSAEEQAADARIAAVYDMFVGAKVLRR